MNIKLLLIAMTIGGITNAAIAGTAVSGGGASIMCANSARLYDLFEGQMREGFAYSATSESSKDLVRKKINSITDYSSKLLLSTAFEQIITNMRFLNSGIGIGAPEDMGGQVATLVPAGCTVGAIGYFENSGRLLVSEDAYAKLDNLNYAAFLFHETTYLLARQTSAAVDSYQSRKVVASFFASNSNQKENEARLKDLLFKNEDFKYVNVSGFTQPSTALNQVRILTTSNMLPTIICMDEAGQEIKRLSDWTDANAEYDISDCHYVRVYLTKPAFPPSPDHKDWQLVDGTGKILFDTKTSYQNYKPSSNSNIILVSK